MPATTRIVHLAALDTLADWEIGYLTAHLPDGWEVRLVGVTAAPIATMGGLRLTPDLTLDELEPSASAALVLPGGETWDTDAGRAVVARVSEFLDAGVPVAAICGATLALASAGLLDDRPHTSNDPSYLAMSGYAGGEHYVAEPAVVDGDLITASGVAPVHFAAAIFARLGVMTPERLASWTKLYADRDPAGFYELMA